MTLDEYLDRFPDGVVRAMTRPWTGAWVTDSLLSVLDGDYVVSVCTDCGGYWISSVGGCHECGSHKRASVPGLGHLMATTIRMTL